MFRSQAQRWNGQIGESQAVCSWLERLLEPLAVNGPKGFGGGGGGRGVIYNLVTSCLKRGGRKKKPYYVSSFSVLCCTALK